MGQKGINFIIIMVGVMMKEAEFFDAGFDGKRDGVVHTAMAPPFVAFVFFGVVLGIENQDIGAADEFEHVPIHAAGARFGIGKKNNQAIGGKKPVTDAKAGMVGALGANADGADIQVEIFDFFDFEIAGEVGKMNGKVGALHLAGQGADQSLAGAFAAEDFQAAAGIVDGAEKREALNMIPVGMGDQQSEIERLAFKFLEQGLAEQAQTGAGIENDDLVTVTDFHAGSVAAVANGAGAGGGDGASHTPKFDGRCGSDGARLNHLPEKIKLKVVGWRGLEPRTNALKGHCSTD